MLHFLLPPSSPELFSPSFLSSLYFPLPIIFQVKRHEALTSVALEVLREYRCYGLSRTRERPLSLQESHHTCLAEYMTHTYNRGGGTWAETIAWFLQMNFSFSVHFPPYWDTASPFLLSPFLLSLILFLPLLSEEISLSSLSPQPLIYTSEGGGDDICPSSFSCHRDWMIKESRHRGELPVIMRHDISVTIIHRQYMALCHFSKN